MEQTNEKEMKKTKTTATEKKAVTAKTTTKKASTSKAATEKKSASAKTATKKATTSKATTEKKSASAKTATKKASTSKATAEKKSASAKTTTKKASTSKAATEKKSASAKTTTKKASTSKAATEKKSTSAKTTTKKDSTSKAATEKKSASAKTTTKKDSTSKAATEKKSASAKTTTKKASASKATAEKKSASAKTTTKKASTSKESRLSAVALEKANDLEKLLDVNENVKPVEYYDLPYRYNQTIIKILAQTPHSIFLYWDISDEDRQNLIDMYGDNFFNITKPVLLVHNKTQNYSFEIEVDDFTNSWYLRTPTSNCVFEVELGRKKIDSYNSKINFGSNDNRLHLSVSNVIESPNDHILDDFPRNVFFKNIKTNELEERKVSNLSNIKNIYKNYEFDNDFIHNPSSNF